MGNNVIGRVLATEKRPTTIDDFTFWTDPQLILNPFDIVKVQHVNNSYSYGVIEDIAHITDAASFLTNFISSDFGDVNAEENTLRVGMNYVTAKVVCNTNNIYIPLQSNANIVCNICGERLKIKQSVPDGLTSICESYKIISFSVYSTQG